MAKLKPDYIEWVLTLNASDAQKEIHNLSEKNKELRDRDKKGYDRFNRHWESWW